MNHRTEATTPGRKKNGQPFAGNSVVASRVVLVSLTSESRQTTSLVANVIQERQELPPRPPGTILHTQTHSHEHIMIAVAGGIWARHCRGRQGKGRGSRLDIRRPRAPSPALSPRPPPPAGTCTTPLHVSAPAHCVASRRLGELPASGCDAQRSKHPDQTLHACCWVEIDHDLRSLVSTQTRAARTPVFSLCCTARSSPATITATPSPLGSSPAPTWRRKREGESRG